MAKKNWSKKYSEDDANESVEEVSEEIKASPEEAINTQAPAPKKVVKGDISQHAKFDKFKKGNKGK